MAPKLERIAELIACGKSHQSVAQELGVPLTTVRRTAQRLRGHIDAIRQEMRDQVVGRVTYLVLRAAESLEHLLADGARDSVRLRAAQLAFAVYQSIADPKPTAESPTLPIHEITSLLARWGADRPPENSSAVEPAARAAEPGLPEPGG